MPVGMLMLAAFLVVLLVGVGLAFAFATRTRVWRRLVGRPTLGAGSSEAHGPRQVQTENGEEPSRALANDPSHHEWISEDRGLDMSRRTAARHEIPPPSSFPPPETLETEVRTDEEDDSLEAFVRSFPKVAPRPAPLVRVSGPPRVVFLHGFAGFADVRVGRLSSAYFRGVAKRLHARGIEASFLRVSPFAPVMVRAGELCEAVRDLGPGRMHLVAHSMGGLDARFALTHLGLRDRVASLVTVATPHKGTPIADVSSRLFRASHFFEKNLGSVLDLTTARMAAFEAETPDADDVHYACVVASPQRGVLGVGPWLLPTYSWLRRRVGDNDGVVPVASQKRGRLLGHLDTDHWGSVGWGGFDAPAFYEGLVLDLLANADYEGALLKSSTGAEASHGSHRLPFASAAW